MKIKYQVAVVPHSIFGYKDYIFEINPMFSIIREYFNKNGFEVHTFDYYLDYSMIKYLLCFALDWEIIFKIKNLKGKKIYFAVEPEVVIEQHAKNRISKLLNYFDMIMTPFDDLIDNERIFKIDEMKHIIPNREGIIPYSSKKLLCNISGYKFSKNSHELYTERLKVIKYFEGDYSDQFTFWGHGNWVKLKSHNYGGIAPDKASIYHSYKFALAFENARGINGYITEKIIDCFIMGIVPIYAGADNINLYIPKDCYIDYYSFKNIGELVQFISNMPFSDYEKYLLAIDNYLESDACMRWSEENFRNNIAKMYLVYLPKIEFLCKSNLISSVKRFLLYYLCLVKKVLRYILSLKIQKKLK